AGKYVENTGLQITKDTGRDAIQIVSVVSDSPAARAGIKARDFIIQVTRDRDDQGKKLDTPEVTPLKGLPIEGALTKLKGKPGSVVKLTIERAEGESK